MELATIEKNILGIGFIVFMGAGIALLVFGQPTAAAGFCVASGVFAIAKKKN